MFTKLSLFTRHIHEMDEYWLLSCPRSTTISFGWHLHHRCWIKKRIFAKGAISGKWRPYLVIKAFHAAVNRLKINRRTQNIALTDYFWKAPWLPLDPGGISNISLILHNIMQMCLAKKNHISLMKFPKSPIWRFSMELATLANCVQYINFFYRKLHLISNLYKYFRGHIRGSGGQAS